MVRCKGQCETDVRLADRPCSLRACGYARCRFFLPAKEGLKRREPRQERWRSALWRGLNETRRASGETRERLCERPGRLPDAPARGARCRGRAGRRSPDTSGGHDQRDNHRINILRNIVNTLFIFCSFAFRPACSIDLPMPQFSPHQDDALKARRRLAQGQARAERHAAGVPPVRLCRHRQDHAAPPHRRGRRRRREVRRLHRQGGLGDARQGLPRRLDHPQPDLPGARERRGSAELRSVGRGARLQGRAHHHRRMLDGRCRARPRPAVVRRAAAGARRSGAVAADPGRRLFHRGRARRDAHRSAPAGRGRSDHPAVDGYPRRRISRARPLRRDRSGRAKTISIRSACSTPTRCWSGATPRGAPTTSACASAAASTTTMPSAGDKLVCLRNNRKKGLFNGGCGR